MLDSGYQHSLYLVLQNMHAYQNQTAEKYQKLLAGNKDAFVDKDCWREFAESCKKRLDALIEKENET